MSQRHPAGPPRVGSALIPPLPAAHGRRRRRTSDSWLLGCGAFAIGIGLGVAAYQWLPGVDVYFDDWLALLS